MISDAPVFFAEARSNAYLEPIAGAEPVGPPVAGVDFIAPLVCDPRNTAVVVVPTANSLFAQGLPEASGDFFDWRTHAKLAPVGQQGKCGGCWAFAVAGCLSDRQVIAAKGQNLDLSPLEMIACAETCQPSCETCSPEQGFSYAKEYGVPSGGVNKDCLKLGTSIPSCSDAKTCAAGVPRVFTTTSKASTATSIVEIKKEIAARGPVCAVYRVFRDFVVASDPKRGKKAFEETGGVYIHVDLHPSAYAPPKADPKTIKSLGDLIGYHAVVIVGWGKQDVSNIPGSSEKTVSLPYWIVRNSWGDKWGDKGYFKCAMSGRQVNQSVAMDLPLTVTTKGGQQSKYGGVFYAQVKPLHGTGLWGASTTSTVKHRLLFLLAAVSAMMLIFWASYYCR